MPRDNPIGSVWLWTRGARPAAIIEVYTSSAGDFQNVLHSLDVRPLSATTRKGWQWRPRPGLTFNTAAGIEPPVASASLRLAQARQFARGVTVIQNEYYDPDQTPTQLRLLPQPLYRFSDPAGGVSDGFLFAYVHGETNPEVILALNSREEGNWQYAFARLGHAEMTARLEQQELWHAPRLENTDEVDSPYSYIPTLLADLPQQASETNETVATP